MKKIPVCWIRTALVVFVVSLSLCAASCAGKRTEAELKDAEGLYQQGLAHVIRGEAPQALAKLLQAEKKNPDTPEIPNAIGLVYYSMEKHDKAIAAYKRAIALDDEFSDAHHNLGSLYITLGRYEEAIAELEKALENDLYVNRVNSLTNAGWAYMQLGRFDTAKERFEEATDIDPLFVIPYSNLGQMYIRQEKYEEAIVELNKAIKFVPKYAEAYYYRGLAQAKLGRYGLARRDFEKTMETDPYGKYAAQAKEHLDLLP